MKNKCLIVDDNPLVLRTTARMVEHVTGWTVECAGSGEEGLSIFENDPGAFGCIITDFDMPCMNGVEFADRLHALESGARLFLMTGNPGAVSGVDLSLHGFEGMLEKPFDLAMLRGLLYSVLPSLDNSPACRSQNLYQRSISFFERSHGIRRAFV